MSNEQEIIIPSIGVQSREIQPGDFVAGLESGIDFEDRLKGEKWIDYALPDIDGDYQWAKLLSGIFDGFTCTNYGCKHSCEDQINWLLAKNKFSVAELTKLYKYKFIKNGKVSRLSARHNAIKSGTNGGQNPDEFLGNYVYKPWDVARNIGMVPEELCPFDRTKTDWTAEKYFDPKCITAEADEAAKAFHEVFDVRYEIVFSTQEDMRKHSQQAPLAISAGVCRPWDERVGKCALNSGHCWAALELPEAPTDYQGQDSYYPAFKRFENGYLFSYAMKGLLTPRSQLKTEILEPPAPNKWLIKMNYKEKSDEIRKLQNFLKQLGYFPKYVESTGYYGTVTCGAVLKFQLFYKLDTVVNLTSWKGKYLGSRTLNQLNLLSK